MGGCCSDLQGGAADVPGTGPTNVQQTESSDAVAIFLQTRGLRGLYMPLELSLSASKLQDMDAFSKSDPMAVLYVRKQDGKLEEVGRTEVILNSLNPAWITKICINYQFEMVQTLVFRVFDIDTKFHNTPVKSLKLNDQDYLGEATCVLSEIVTKQDRSVTLKLQKGPGMMIPGSLTVHAEETVASKQAIELIFRCTHLENKDTFSKSDPFIRISRTVESGALIPICKTEVINDNLNPVWRPITLTTQQFNSKENPLVLECFDFESSGNHVLLGRLDASIAELERLHRERTGTNFYVNRHGQRKVLKGQLFVDKFEEKIQYSFLDYISGGFEINFMVAIDFTASNGDPRMPQSLHYIDPTGRLNSYQQAIIGVGEVLQFYDTDKRFPAWGFGGRTPDRNVSHCFNLNLLPMEAEVVGLEGIMGAYSTALHSVALAGPTLFGPVINKAAEIAAHSLSYSQNKYFVLLIITDGVINDLKETKDAIVRASDLPLSILIVGVGSADFKEMEILDADGGRRLESSTGRVATRDIVQFVPMRDFLDSYHPGSKQRTTSDRENEKEPPNYLTHCSHQHQLVRTDLGPAQIFGCDVCQYPGIGTHYRCNACDFDLHENCAKLPERISFFAHPGHNLFLSSGQHRICHICSQSAEGFFYRCIGCNFDVHPHCTTIQQVVRTALHPEHSLSLIAGVYTCSSSACSVINGAWFYRCVECSISLHINCLHGPEQTMENAPETEHNDATNNNYNHTTKRGRFRQFMKEVGTKAAQEAIATTIAGLFS